MPDKVATPKAPEPDRREIDGSPNSIVDAIVIGRNEGQHLGACLASVAGRVRQIVYVDSGSTDDSVSIARSFGLKVVQLDPTRPFTAARARNAGLAALLGPPPDFVQMIDGDCMLRGGWIETATRFLKAHPKVAIVCGRRREQHPDASVYNRLCNMEWNTPVGSAKACGGDSLMRYDAVVGCLGFREDLIAGEEPELCVRLGRAGWHVWRLDAEMTLHDANILRFGQWVRRTRRAGHAFAEGAALHGAGPERHWVRETRRAVAWGLLLPLASGLAAIASPFGALLLLPYPLQILRLAWRMGPTRRSAWEFAVFTTLGKFPEAAGVIDYFLGRLRGRKTLILEYE